MYKDKMTLWHFDKKNKTCEMKAIIHRKRKRDAAGKPSTFRVRGKVVDCCAVSRYLKKKKVLEEDFFLGPDSPTLSDLSGLSCLTHLRLTRMKMRLLLMGRLLRRRKRRIANTGII
jgi:hypothetical protein